MRSGELLALTLADILPDKRISINKNFAIINGQELFLTPKNAKEQKETLLYQISYTMIYKRMFQHSMAYSQLTEYFISLNLLWKRNEARITKKLAYLK